jgi:hypothetical protein
MAKTTIVHHGRPGQNWGKQRTGNLSEPESVRELDAATTMPAPAAAAFLDTWTKEAEREAEI